MVVIPLKKLLICSDSHGHVKNLLAAVETEAPDSLLHLGDGERDLARVRERWPVLPIANVRGNCDDWTDTPLQRVFSVEGHRVFMVHGHELNVRWDRELLRLRYAAMEQGAELALFGHTHRPYLDGSGGLWVLNPGSIGNGQYAVVTVDGDTLRPELKQVTSNK